MSLPPLGGRLPRKFVRSIDRRTFPTNRLRAYAARPENYQDAFLGRNIMKDQALAKALLEGLSLEQAAAAVGMDPVLAIVVQDSAAFQALLRRLRTEAETFVYEQDPDRMTESLARGNVWTLQQIRDDPRARDADRIKSAMGLHDMRPTVVAQQRKQEDTGVRITLSTDVMDRLQDGLQKMRSLPVIEIDREAMQGTTDVPEKETPE